MGTDVLMELVFMVNVEGEAAFSKRERAGSNTMVKKLQWKNK